MVSSSNDVRSAHRQNPRDSSRHAWLSPPEPIRRIFNYFPLVTYNSSSRPQRTPRSQDEHTLYIFAPPTESTNVGLSCNPACLKWQAFLRCHGIPVVLRASNNHASPSGALPFLLPKISSEDPRPSPIEASQILKWAASRGVRVERQDTRQEAFTALIDHDIRNAWLYHLYLDAANFQSVARRLYVETASTNPAVQAAISSQLRAAAEIEFLKSQQTLDADDIYKTAAEAFSALSDLLGDDSFFFGRSSPSIFDISLFAYTHLLVAGDLAWSTLTLQRLLARHANLRRHEKSIYELCVQN